MVNCCVPFCKNRPDQKKFSFFSFPTDEKKRQLWLDRIGRKNPDGSKWIPKMSAKVCSYHFSRGRSFGAPDRFDSVPTENKRWEIVPPKERKSSLAFKNSLTTPWRQKLNVPKFDPWSQNDLNFNHAKKASVDCGTTILTYRNAQSVPIPPREPEVCNQNFADTFFRKYTGKPYVQKNAVQDQLPPETSQGSAPQELRSLKRSATAETSIFAKVAKKDKQEATPILVTLLVPVMTVPVMSCGQSSSIMILQRPLTDVAPNVTVAAHPQTSERPQMVIRPSGQQPQVAIGPSGKRPHMVLGAPTQKPQIVLEPFRQLQIVPGPSKQRPEIILRSSGQQSEIVIGPSRQYQQTALGTSGTLQAGHQETVVDYLVQPHQPVNSNKSPVPLNSWELPTYKASKYEDKEVLECYQVALSGLRKQVEKLQHEILVLRKRAIQTPPFAQLALVVSAAKEGQENALLLLEQILAYDSHLHYWSPQMLQKCSTWRTRACHSYLRALKMGLFSLPCTGTLSRAKTHGPSQRWQSQWMLLADLLLR